MTDQIGASGRAAADTVGGRSAASLAEAIPAGQPWGPLRSACSSDILLAPGDAMWIPSGTVHAVLGTPGLAEVGPERGGTGSSLHYNVQLATIGLGDIAAWYLAWKVDLGPTGDPLHKPFTAEGSSGAGPAAGGTRTRPAARGVGRIGVEAACGNCDIIRGHFSRTSQPHPYHHFGPVLAHFSRTSQPHPQPRTRRVLCSSSCLC